jgi:hypothetical protein
VLIHAGDTAGVIARAGRIIPGISGAKGTVGVLVHQEVLNLRTDFGLHALLTQPGERVFENHPWGEGPGLAVHVWVAVNYRQAFFDEGYGRKGCEVGNRNEV